MTFDTAVPKQLMNTQIWFGSIISRPIDDNSLIDPISPSGLPIEHEARNYIAPSPTLRPAQRIEIYNQQYWFRLLTTLQENLPLVTRLFGYVDFNQLIAMPYLMKYPPDHWSISFVGNRLPLWIEEEYHANDKELVLNAAKIDCAFLNSFLAEEKPVIDLAQLPQPGDFSSISDKSLTLQPHVHLFQFPYDLFQFRTEFLLNDADYWLGHDFPKMKHFSIETPGHFVMYRNRSNIIEVKKIGGSEYALLKLFEHFTSVDDICNFLEKQPPESALYRDAEKELNIWFCRWFSHFWLSYFI